jgi:hypothetical protein
MVRRRPDDRFPGIAPAGLVGIVAVGVLFFAMGIHARRAGYWNDRPARPWFQIGIGSVMALTAGDELIRRWWRDRAERRANQAPPRADDDE